jgi:uncharacterized protein (DUF983 family)
MPPSDGPAPLAPVALLGRCPRCGSGLLFTGLLNIRPAHTACGLDLVPYDQGDGSAMAGIFVVGALAVIAALVVDTRYQPPLWVHALLWPALILPLSVLVMRIAKALLVGIEYRMSLRPAA